MYSHHIALLILFKWNSFIPKSWLPQCIAIYFNSISIVIGPIEGELRSSTIGVPWKHLTKAERKRVEWERQRAEAEALKQEVQRTQQLHQSGSQTAVPVDTTMADAMQGWKWINFIIRKIDVGKSKVVKFIYM